MKIVLIIAAIALAACESTEERVAKLCVGFGYPPGSAALSDCESQQYSEAMARHAVAAQILSKSGCGMTTGGC